MRQAMFISRVDKQHRITIPTATRKVLKISPGDYFEVSITKVSDDGGVVEN